MLLSGPGVRTSDPLSENQITPGAHWHLYTPVHHQWTISVSVGRGAAPRHRPRPRAGLHSGSPWHCGTALRAEYRPGKNNSTVTDGFLRSSVRYGLGTRLGDLEESCFILFFN